MGRHEHEKKLLFGILDTATTMGGLQVLLWTLLGWCEAYSLLTAPKVVTHAMRNKVGAICNARDEFCFGTTQKVIGIYGGQGKGLRADEEARQQDPNNFLNSADAFRFGSDRKVIGCQGGPGKGLDLSQEISEKNQKSWRGPSDEFRFGSGRVVVG